MNRIKRRAKKVQDKPESTQPESTPGAYTLPDLPTTEELDELLKGLPTIEEVVASLPPCNFDELPTFSKKELERLRLDVMKVLAQAKEQIDKLFLN